MKWIILLQLGTPESLDNKSIGKYLREFLMDPRTINMPWFFRYILVNGIIVPRRVDKVRKRYAQIWNSKTGSPLKYYGNSLTEKLNTILPDDYKAFHVMRFGSDSIESILKKAEIEHPEKIIFIPLFPHETEATTGSIRAEVDRVLDDLSIQSEIKWLPVFDQDQGYLQLMANKLKMMPLSAYDKVLFSFHGLPLKQIEAAHKGKSCELLACSDAAVKSNYYCYTRACYQTAAKIAGLAGLNQEDFSVAFQSRFGKRWIGPQTEDVILELANEGKSVLIMAPSFLTDCLETSWEIGISFRELYAKTKGGKFDWIPALNDDDDWVRLIHDRSVI